MFIVAEITPMFTEGGNSQGRPCEFPFLYKGEEHFTCIPNPDTHKLWCGTSYDFDTDGRWGYCVQGRKQENSQELTVN